MQVNIWMDTLEFSLHSSNDIEDLAEPNGHFVSVVFLAHFQHLLYGSLLLTKEILVIRIFFVVHFHVLEWSQYNVDM